MKIKDLHPDISRFLQYDCYCPNEIYSFDGFCYELFPEDTECELIDRGKSCVTRDNLELIAVKATSTSDDKQIVLFFVDGEKIVDALRMDATKNNHDLISRSFTEKILQIRFDEYTPGKTNAMIEEILELSDGLVIAD